MFLFQIKGNILCFSSFMLFWFYIILTLNIICWSGVFVNALKDSVQHISLGWAILKTFRIKLISSQLGIVDPKVIPLIFLSLIKMRSIWT